MMNRLEHLLKVKYPIVQAPMLGVTSPEMVAAVSNAGALGSLPLGGLSPDRARELIRVTKTLTAKPFAVNLFAHSAAESINNEEIAEMQVFLAELCREFAIPYEVQNVDTFRFHYYEELLPVLLEERIPVVSFTFGQLKPEVIDSVRNNGATIIGTATSVAEAQLLAQDGVDILTIQGLEAGGHRGSFLAGEHLPQIGLFSLLPQVRDEVSLPLLAAGGIYNANTVKAAFTLGATGIQIGSALLTAKESLASDAYKMAVLNAKDTATELTRAFSGKWARGITNEFMRRMKIKDLPIPYYTYQNQLMGNLRTYAQQNNLPDFIAMWAGQSAGKSVRGTTEQIINNFIAML